MLYRDRVWTVCIGTVVWTRNMDIQYGHALERKTGNVVTSVSTSIYTDYLQPTPPYIHLIHTPAHILHTLISHF
jgi:hypothetical protein